MYDVRGTMYDLESSAATPRIWRSECEVGCRETMHGRDYKGAEADGACLCTTYDRKVRARCAGMQWRRVDSADALPEG